MRVDSISKTTFLVLILGAMLTSCAGIGGGYSSGTTYQYAANYGGASSGTKVITVQAGDTLYSIARTYNMDVQTLIDENDLIPPYHLREGQSLRIPQDQYHTVQRGETIYSISKTYNVDMASLALMNDIDPPYNISVGQQLRLPAMSAGSADWKSDSPYSYGGDEMIVADPKKYKEQTQARKEEDYGTAPSEGRFLRPVAGRLVSSFGKKGGGQQNDGINVSAPAGAPIFAADDGVVTYTGNELRGYGNLILVKHSDGWVSAYAHIERFRVARGDYVTRGQHIADVGQTGNVTSPQLHFELRRGVDPVNPVLHLSPR